MNRWTNALCVTLLAGAPAALSQTEPGTSQPERAARPALAHRAGAQPQAQPQADEQESRPRSPDAVAVLQAAAEAVKDGFAATVKTHLESDSAMAGMFPTTEGRWIQKALTDDGQWAVRHTGYGTVSQGKDQVGFDLLWQPDRVSWVDDETKTFYIQPMLRGNKPGSAHQLGNAPWDRAAPLADGFADVLARAAAIEMHEPAEIDGRACDVVSIVSKPKADAVLWYFDHATHLPRRCEVVLPDNPMLSGAMRVDFLDPTTGPDAAPLSEFEIVPPDSYARNINSQFREHPDPAELEQTAVPPVRTNADAAGLPDWEVKDTDGNLVSPHALKGEVAVLYFWGTWSTPAKKVTPEIKALAERYAGKPVEIIGMAFRENDPSAVAGVAAEQGQTWRQVPKADDAASVLSVHAAPAVVVLGKEGELLYKSGRPTGDYTEQFDRIRAIIDQALLAEPAPTDNKERAASAGEGREIQSKGATRAAPPRKIIRKKD